MTSQSGLVRPGQGVQLMPAPALAEMAHAGEDGRGPALAAPKGPVRADDWLTAGLLGGSFMVFAAACASQGVFADWRRVALAAALVVVYGLAQRTVYNAPTGDTVPTEPVLVAMLFTLPIATVPALVLGGLLLGGGLRKGHAGVAHEVAVRAASGWHSAGPVVVLWAAGVRAPSFGRWPVLVLALASQFLLDAGVAGLRCVSLGSPLRRLVEPLRFTYSVDALLAPLAVCVVLAAARDWYLVPFLVVLPVGLLRVLVADRNKRFNTAVTLSRALQSERGEARSDPLTGVGNRRAWEEAVVLAEDKASRDGALPGATVVLMADVDHLKLVNDTYGHGEGDQLLRAFASVLADAAPPGALVARLGGDEFGVLFRVPRTDDGEAHDINELVSKVRSAMASRTIPCGETVSASLGAAACPPAPSIAAAIGLADAAAAQDKGMRHAQRTPVADLRVPAGLLAGHRGAPAGPPGPV
jgi:diguanylate cyclase (GGDEF)-like protein